MATAVIDVGKTNLKLAVIDARGRLLDLATQPNFSIDAPPYPHFDVEALWEWTLAALAEAGHAFAIDAIVPVTHGCAAALMAGDELAMPILDYEHHGPDAVEGEYRALVDPFSLGYTPPLALGLNLGKQIFWQRSTFERAFARVTDIVLYPQYWAWRLCGSKATEVTSLGVHTDLWRPGERRYGGLVERAGWSDLFPPLRRAWETLGALRPEVAARCGLDPACRVLCGLHDSNAAYLVHLAARRAPFAVVSSGTWTIVMASGAPLARLDAARDMVANVDVNGDPVPTARFMGGREFEAIAGDAQDTAATAACAATVIDRGTMALPSFAPDSGPFMGRQGGVSGPRPADAGERVAVGSLYSALVVDLMLDLLDAGGPVLVEGPLAGNRIFTGALGALRPDRSVEPQEGGAGTGGGAALLAHWLEGSPTPAPSAPVEPLSPAGLAKYRAAWRAACAAPAAR